MRAYIQTSSKLLVILQFKSGNKNTISNYCPIWTFHFFSKIFEIIMEVRLVDFVVLTESALLIKCDTVYEFSMFYNGSEKFSLQWYLTFPKCSISSITIFWCKVKKMVIWGSALDWLWSYLTSRNQINNVNYFIYDLTLKQIGILKVFILYLLHFWCPFIMWTST